MRSPSRLPGHGPLLWVLLLPLFLLLAGCALLQPPQSPADAAWQAELGKVAEGSQVTLGAYNRPWR